VHIGSTDMHSTDLNYYVLGKRAGHKIIDLFKVYGVIQNVLYMLKGVAKNYGYMCFFTTTYASLLLIERCALVSLSLVSYQSILIYEWVYGYVNNYYFCIHYFFKDLFRLVLKYTLPIFGIGIADDYKNLLAYDYHEKDIWDSATTAKIEKHVNRFGFRSDWEDYYKRSRHHDEGLGIKMVLDRISARWGIGKYYYFIRSLRSSRNFTTSFRKNKFFYTFRYFLLKLFYFLDERKKDVFFWSEDDDREEEGVLCRIHSKLIFYWRLLLYFKYFQSIFVLPDVFFCVYMDGNELPVKEACRRAITIGLVDTCSPIGAVHYPIVHNSSSMTIIIFYLSLFCSVFTKFNVTLYSKFLNGLDKI
jgi:hypothetical protein